MNPKILVELVPKTSWYNNVRSIVAPNDWDILRKDAYKRANHKCSICDAKGRLEAHEIWHYNDQLCIQKLDEIKALCHSCHMVYHLGFASVNGEYDKTIKHLGKLNQWTKEETILYADAVFEVWYMRSRKQWTIDLTLLDKLNISYNNHPKK